MKLTPDTTILISSNNTVKDTGTGVVLLQAPSLVKPSLVKPSPAKRVPQVAIAGATMDGSTISMKSQSPHLALTHQHLESVLHRLIMVA